MACCSQASPSRLLRPQLNLGAATASEPGLGRFRSAKRPRSRPAEVISRGQAGLKTALRNWLWSAFGWWVRASKFRVGFRRRRMEGLFSGD